MTNLPTFATHNAGTTDFTIPQTTDLALIGEYIVTIKSEMQVPTDHTKSAFTPWVVEYTFPIRMQPCRVTTYSRSLVAGPINHAV